MFCRDLMPRANDAALQERESRFDAVRGNVAVNIDPGAVIDCLVLRAGVSGQLNCTWVGSQIVSHNHMHVVANILSDVLGKCPLLCIFSPEEPKLSIPLLNADHAFFMISAALKLPAALFAADIGFVPFYNAIQRLRIDFIAARMRWHRYQAVL